MDTLLGVLLVNIEKQYVSEGGLSTILVGVNLHAV